MLDSQSATDRIMDLLDQPALLILSGLFSALIFVVILFANAQLYFGQRRWPEGLLVILGVLGAILSLCALWPNLWLIPVSALLLLLGAAVFFWKRRAQFAHGKASLGWRPLLALLLLLLQAIWAAAPFCRYDQWNYHLVAAKYILANHVLPAVIYDDHIFFTGIYEFLLLIPRWFLAHDIWLASLADCLTWLLTATIIAAALRRFASWNPDSEGHADNLADRRSPHFLVMLAFVMALSPYQHSLTNAKPEALLAAISLLILVSWPKGKDREVDWRYLGWLMVWPLALKVTWLHAAAVFIVALIVERWRRQDSRGILLAIQGGLLALLMQLPIWLKNTVFFANPLHPLQLPGLHSRYWHSAMAEHWQVSSGAARSLSAYWRILGRHFPQVIVADFWPFLLLIALPWLWVILRRLRLFANGISVQSSTLAAGMSSQLLERRRLVLTVMMIFALLTPLALDPKVQARFALPLLGMIIFLVLIQLRTLAWSPRRMESLILVMTLFFGSWDVSLRKLGELIESGSIRNFYTDYGPPYEHLPIAELINQHRRLTYGKPPLEQHVVVSFEPTKYFFDSAHIRWNHYDYQMMRLDFLARTGARGTVCQFLLDYSMRYFVVTPLDWPRLDAEFQVLLRQFGEHLSTRYPIWHLAPERLRAAQKDLKLCPLLETR